MEPSASLRLFSRFSAPVTVIAVVFLCFGGATGSLAQSSYGHSGGYHGGGYHGGGGGGGNGAAIGSAIGLGVAVGTAIMQQQQQQSQEQRARHSKSRRSAKASDDGELKKSKRRDTKGEKNKTEEAKQSEPDKKSKPDKPTSSPPSSGNSSSSGSSYASSFKIPRPKWRVPLTAVILTEVSQAAFAICGCSANETVASSAGPMGDTNDLASKLYIDPLKPCTGRNFGYCQQDQQPAANLVACTNWKNWDELLERTCLPERSRHDLARWLEEHNVKIDYGHPANKYGISMHCQDGNTNSTAVIVDRCVSDLNRDITTFEIGKAISCIASNNQIQSDTSHFQNLANDVACQPSEDSETCRGTTDNIQPENIFGHVFRGVYCGLPPGKSQNASRFIETETVMSQALPGIPLPQLFWQPPENAAPVSGEVAPLLRQPEK